LQAKALLVSLSDGVSVHTLPELDLVAHLYKTRGATSYALNLEHNLLSVALRRKLLLYSYDNGKDFAEKGEITIPDAVRTMIWCGENAICVGIGRQYSLLNVQTKVMGDVFSTGRVGPPVATALPDGELLLSKVRFPVFRVSFTSLFCQGSFLCIPLPLILTSSFVKFAAKGQQF
jgi:hypothetical protein